MAYLRWSGSSWYVYWHASPAIKPGDELVSVNCDMLFTQREVKKDLEGVIKKVYDHYESNPGPMDELERALKEFVDDVDAHYEQLRNERRNNK